jgi:hypothetical protein
MAGVAEQARKQPAYASMLYGKAGHKLRHLWGGPEIDLLRALTLVGTELGRGKGDSCRR